VAYLSISEAVNEIRCVYDTPRNALLGAIDRGLGGAFARKLLEDLQNHGTLAERTLRKIADTAGKDDAFNE